LKLKTSVNTVADIILSPVTMNVVYTSTNTALCVIQNCVATHAKDQVMFGARKLMKNTITKRESRYLTCNYCGNCGCIIQSQNVFLGQKITVYYVLNAVL
jgi:hypothetical protein